MIGNLEVIDAHCHVYPEKIAERAVAGTDHFYGTTAACSGTVSGLEEILAEGRIDRCLIHSVATTPKQVSSINRFIAAEVANHPKQFFGFGALHPESDDLERDVRELLDLGLKGVKLHPDIQRFPLDEKNCMTMYGLCQEAGLPLLIHTGDCRYDFSNPNRIKPVLTQFPRLTVVGAHMGGWSVWEQAYEELSSFSNFYVDCSSTFCFWEPKKAKDLICRWGFDRVIFGSDYPMWHPLRELETFLSFDLGEVANRKILGENAKRIFSMEQ